MSEEQEQQEEQHEQHSDNRPKVKANTDYSFMGFINRIISIILFILVILVAYVFIKFGIPTAFKSYDVTTLGTTVDADNNDVVLVDTGDANSQGVPIINPWIQPESFPTMGEKVTIKTVRFKSFFGDRTEWIYKISR